MKTTLIRSLTVAALLAVTVAVVAEDQQQPFVGSASFEKLKSLVGTWEGMVDCGNGPQLCKTEYTLSSGGSAIVEKCMVGTPMEMISVYHDNSKGTLTMTHYCAMHNQPKMELKQSTQDSLVFDLAKDADIDLSEMHMHGLTIKFDGPNQITQSCIAYMGGKPMEHNDSTFKRVK